MHLTTIEADRKGLRDPHFTEVPHQAPGREGRGAPEGGPAAAGHVEPLSEAPPPSATRARTQVDCQGLPTKGLWAGRDAWGSRAGRAENGMSAVSTPPNVVSPSTSKNLIWAVLFNVDDWPISVDKNRKKKWMKPKKKNRTVNIIDKIGVERFGLVRETCGGRQQKGIGVIFYRLKWLLSCVSVNASLTGAALTWARLKTCQLLEFSACGGRPTLKKGREAGEAQSKGQGHCLETTFRMLSRCRFRR